MDSIGDYLYIVMIAIAVISGIFKNKKKKLEQAEYPYPDEETAEEYGEVYEELLPEETEIYTPVQTQPAAQQPISEKGNYQTAFTSLEGMSNYNNTKDTTKLRAKKEVTGFKQKSTESAITQEADQVALKLNSREDVRAAFIASEIFNRKY